MAIKKSIFQKTELDFLQRRAEHDDAIVHEVLNHRHDAKQRIPEDRWCKALGWMREKGFVPQGVALP